MDFRLWQEEQRKSSKQEPDTLPDEKFFGRKAELLQLQSFVQDASQRVFFLCGVPMIGKSILVREFCKIIPEYKQVVIKFNNPENPETTIERSLGDISSIQEKIFVVIENFEEALQWKGNLEHLHEIKFQKVRQFVQTIDNLPNAKLLLESRFQIKNDFLPASHIAELDTKQLGKIDRQELYDILNTQYREGEEPFESFEQLCISLNDHVWLIELAMQNKWLYEDILEAAQRPESLTQKLWEKVQAIIRKLSTQHRSLLCAFGIINPLAEIDIQSAFENLAAFQNKGELPNALLSLRKKLLLVYDAKQKQYEINPFLREVCFTYLKGQKEMKAVEGLPFFSNAPLPKYNEILQAHAKGDFRTFFNFIKEKRRNREFTIVLEVLQEAFWTNPKPEVILNEIGVTYKWKKDYPKAIETLEKACELGNIHSFNELAIVYKEQKEFQKAIETLEKALKVEPQNLKVLNELAIVYKEQKEFKKAIETLEKALKVEPQNLKVLNELAIVYKEQKEFKKAIEVLTQLIQKYNHIPAYNELAIVYKEQKEFQKAIETLEKACELGNIHSFNELAIVYKEQKEFQKAIETLEKALKVEPQNVKVLNELAIVYKELGNFEIALSTVNKGLKVEPNNPFLKSTKAKIENEKNTVKAPTAYSIAEKQKILFISASPTNESRLQTDKEYLVIKAEIRRGSHRDAFEFLQPQIAVTISELLRALNEKPQIVHFAGHGGTDGVFITNDNNQSILLPLPAIERLFTPLKGITKIVVLNSCYSGEQAKAISEYGMYVVANNLSIDDDAAISFSKGLYNGLSEGKQFESAFNDAMAVVLTESNEYANVIEVWKDGVKLAL